MEFELDTNARQLVRWLRQEMRKPGEPRVTVRATREYAVDREADFERAGISPEAELAALVSVGTLEVTPVEARYPWLLRLRVEDSVGPHAPDDESVSDEPEEIDLDGFEADFVKPDRGNSFLTLEAETEQAREDFELLLGEIVRDRHRG